MTRTPSRTYQPVFAHLLYTARPIGHVGDVRKRRVAYGTEAGFLSRLRGVMRPPEPPEPAGLTIFFITGNGTSISCTPQSAADGGINVSAAGAATVAGARGRATTGQSVQAGRDATVARGRNQSSGKGWWARLRERGVVVTIATIVGAIVAVIGTAVAICAWVGWIP
jgi:hypothetical protein